MNYVLNLLICIAAVEIITRSNFTSISLSYYSIIKKVFFITSNRNISDHWKEKVFLAYSAQLIWFSTRIFVVLASICSIFLLINYFSEGLLTFSFSLLGLSQMALVAYIYLRLRKFLFP